MEKEREKMISEMNQKLEKEEEELKVEIENLKINSFNSTYEVLELINKIADENNINIKLIGRESNSEISDEEADKKQSENFPFSQKEFFLHSYGYEKDIFNFIRALELNNKFVKMKSSTVLIEKLGEYTDLKCDIIYLVSPTEADTIPIQNYETEIFENAIPTKFESKRRQI